MNFTKKVAYAVASAALAFGAFAPVAFASDLEISGNGNGSHNDITVTDVSTCVVSQTSTTKVGAVIVASADTGGNTASGNTGGDVSIDTGNATATATLTVTGGSNTATNPCCCDTQCETGDFSALISGNGNGSHNDITTTNTNTSVVTQSATTKVKALLKAKAKTGKNKAKNNTGGTTSIDTGNATSTTGLTVTGGSNTLN